MHVDTHHLNRDKIQVIKHAEKQILVIDDFSCKKGTI